MSEANPDKLVPVIMSGGSALILEPVGRNTAPAIAVAALQAQAGGAGPVLLDGRSAS